MRLIISTLLCIFCSLQLFSQQEILPIWNSAPDKELSDATTRLYVYLAENDSTPCPSVIICPGGSYHHLGMPHEGYQVAEWFQKNGINAFVLRYRVSSHGYHNPAMIEDIQRAICLLREHSKEFNTDTSKIGAIGFSAGGHLVAHAGATHTNYLENELKLQTKVSLRPNFVMSIYPVVSMEDSIAHTRSRKNLLTKHYTQEDIHSYSLEQIIPDDMPPTFILTAHDDDVVDFRNSQALWDALQAKQIQHCTFIPLQSGGHGFGMYKTTETTQDWNEKYLKEWLQTILQL